MNQEPKCTLLEHTKNKLIIECTKDTLWGTGVPLDNEKCLDSTMWKGHGTKRQGIMGEILCEIRNELEETARDHTLHPGQFPPPSHVQQQYVPSGQNAPNYIVNQYTNLSFSMTPSIPISSNIPCESQLTKNFTDHLTPTQYPGT